MSEEQSQEHGLVLPETQPVALWHLSHLQLKALASVSGVSSVGVDRRTLQDSLTHQVHTTRQQTWTQKVVPGSVPERPNGALCSYGRDLYVIGGHRPGIENQSLIIKCKSDTECWEPVTSDFEPDNPFPGRPSGVLCNSSFCAIGGKSSVESAKQMMLQYDTTQGVAPGEPVLHRYSFSGKHWCCQKLPGPACGHGSLLAAHGRSLIVYGKGRSAELCPEEAVWTADPDRGTWQARRVTGDLPPQARAFAMTVANNNAYVSVLEESPSMGLRIYELDLQSWNWRRLPDLNTDFQLDPLEDTIATTLIHGRWMMHGGSYESSPDEFENQLHVFDFNTMLWSKPVLSDQDMGYRTGHMAACHNDHMIIMGGQNGNDSVSEVMCITPHPQLYSSRSDRTLRNFEPVSASQRQLFPDAIVTVGGRDFLVHRNVLSAASPYFHCMFSSETLEGITAKAVIADIEPETFELVLSWMYGTIDYCPWLCKAAKLYVASDRLGMTVLKDACAQAIALALPMTIHSEHIEDIEELWEFATEIQSAVVRDACKEYLSRSTEGRFILRGSKEGYQRLMNCYSSSTCGDTTTTNGSPSTQSPSEVGEAHVGDASAEVDDIGSVIDVDELIWIDELQSSDTADAEQSTDPVASPSSTLSSTSQSMDDADTATVSGLGGESVNGTRQEVLLSSPVSPPSGLLVKAEVQEDEPKPAAVVPFAGAWATLSALLKWPARGGSQGDEAICEDSSVTSDSHSDTSSSAINSGRAASISSCIRGDSDSVTTDRNSLNSQGSMVTSPKGSFASAESEDSSAESEDSSAESEVSSAESEDSSAESEVSSAESEISSGKHSFSEQVTSLGGQGAGEVDEQGTGRGAAECKIKASWPDLAGQTAISQHLYLCSRMATSPLEFSQGGTLEFILNKGPVDVADSRKEQGSTEGDEAAVIQSCAAGPEVEDVQDRHSGGTSAAEDSIKASRPDLAGQTAIPADLHLSSRMAAIPLGFSRGRRQQGMMDNFGLKVVLDKGSTQTNSVEADEAAVVQPCTEGGLLCGPSCPEPTCQPVASPDRSQQESRNEKSCFQRAVGAVGQLGRGWAGGEALLRKGLLGVAAGGRPPMRR